MMNASKSFAKHPKHNALYEALMESMLVDKDDMDTLAMDPATKTKRRYDDAYKDPSARPKQVQAVDNAPEQPWFNDLLSAKKDLLTFDELLATTIDFSKFAMNTLKIDKLTKAELVGPVYKLLKGTCLNNIKLEYIMEECYKALADQLNWENLKGNQCLFDLSKPLPLKVHLSHLIVATKYFLNNDLEFLKSTDPKKRYTTLITKMKAAKYELVGIEDMISKLLSRAKVGYDKDVERVIKHWGPKRYNKGMPRRKWSATDRRRSGLMVELIDKQMLERRIIRNLERLVRARTLEIDYRLM
nr:hypothetical protein [Tanacetum cinerariifolium]